MKVHQERLRHICARRREERREEQRQRASERETQRERDRDFNNQIILLHATCMYCLLLSLPRYAPTYACSACRMDEDIENLSRSVDLDRLYRARVLRYGRTVTIIGTRLPRANLRWWLATPS